MKKIVLFLLLASAASMATPAVACQLEVSGSAPVAQPSATGDQFTASSIVSSIANGFAEAPSFKDAKCTKEMIQTKLLLENDWSPDQLVSRTATIKLVRPFVAPVQKPAADVSVAATQVAAKPLAESSAEVRKAQANLQTAKQVQTKLKAEVAAIPSGVQLSPEDRAKVDQLLNVNKVVKDLEAVVKRLSAVEADVLTLQNDMGKKANKLELDALGNRVANLENAPPVTETGWTWYEWVVAGLSVLGALAFLLAVYVVFFRKVDVRTAVSNALQTAGLSQTVFRAELDALKGEVEKLSTDVADSAKDHKQVELPANLEEQLKALDEGQSTEIVGTISGNRGLIGFTKSGDNFVTTTDIDKQTQPMNIEKISKHGCGIRSTLLRHIGAGRVKLRPIAQAVNS